MDNHLATKRDLIDVFETFFGDPYIEINLTIKESARILKISTKTLRLKIKENPEFVKYNRMNKTINARSVIDRKFSLQKRQ